MAWTHSITSSTDNLLFMNETQGDVMVAIDHSIYIIGYEKRGGELQVHIFNVETAKWNKVRLMEGNNDSTPRELERYFAVVHDGNILVYAQNFSLDCSLFVLNTQTLEWNSMSPDGDISWNERWSGGCLLHGDLYILKGSIKLELWALDLGIMRWRYVSEIELDNSFRPERFLAYENCVYILIEVLRDESLYISIIYYDTVSKTWGCLDEPGRAEFSHPAWRSFFYSKHFYYISGIPHQRKIVFRYSLERMEWETIRFEGIPPLHGYLRGNVVILDSKAFFLEFWEPGVLHVLDFDPSLKVRCLAAVSKYGLDTSELPDSLQKELSKYKRSA